MKNKSTHFIESEGKVDIASFPGLVEIRKGVSNCIEAGALNTKLVSLLMTESGCAPVEGELLDYKRELGSDAISLAKCIIQIVSLHNTYGGYLVFGVEEKIRDQHFFPCGIAPESLNLQKIKAAIRNYTGQTIDISYLDIPIAFQQGFVNLGVLYVPKRVANVAPIKFGKVGPSKNSSPLFTVDDVFFVAKMQMCARNLARTGGFLRASVPIHMRRSKCSLLRWLGHERRSLMKIFLTGISFVPDLWVEMKRF